MAIPGDICKTNGHFYFTSSPPCLSVLYKNLASRPWWDGYLETLVCHLLSLPAFWVVEFLALTPLLWVIGLLCSEQSKLGLSKNAFWKPCWSIGFEWLNCSHLSFSCLIISIFGTFKWRYSEFFITLFRFTWNNHPLTFKCGFLKRRLLVHELIRVTCLASPCGAL